jgi:hypothetical protein
MKSICRHVFETLFSFAVFAAIAIAIASTAYHVFNPDGGLLSWIAREWQNQPVTLAFICLGGLMLKHWLSGHQDVWLANGLFYAALLVGAYSGFSLLA